jgi:hypothetical protein
MACFNVAKLESLNLGFEVDGDIPVHRPEVYERIIAGSPPEDPIADSAAQMTKVAWCGDNNHTTSRFASPLNTSRRFSNTSNTEIED